MPHSGVMDSLTHHRRAPTQRPKWLEILYSVLRVLVGVTFIFWLLTLMPTRSDPSAAFPVALLLLGAALYGFVMWLQLHRVSKSDIPGILAAESLILSAALFLAIFSAIYVILDGNSPGSFSEPINHFTATYFALTVLATVGFGDITAVSDPARFVVMIQMALGLVFIGALIRVFTSAAQRARDARRKRQDEARKE